MDRENQIAQFLAKKNRLEFSELSEATRLRALFESIAASRPQAPTPTVSVVAPTREVDVKIFRETLQTLNSAIDEFKLDAGFLNVWSVAGLDRSEGRITNVLAWSFDHRATHGLGSSILAEFLTVVSSRLENSDLANVELTQGYTVETEHISFGDNSNRVDIAIHGNDFILYIEVKVDAAEGVEQRERYLKMLSKRAHAHSKKVAYLIYLANANSEPVTGAISATWRDVADAIRKSVRRVNSRSKVSVAIMKQFSRFVRTL